MGVVVVVVVVVGTGSGEKANLNAWPDVFKGFTVELLPNKMEGLAVAVVVVVGNISERLLGVPSFFTSGGAKGKFWADVSGTLSFNVKEEEAESGLANENEMGVVAVVWGEALSLGVSVVVFICGVKVSGIVKLAISEDLLSSTFFAS